MHGDSTSSQQLVEICLPKSDYQTLCDYAEQIDRTRREIVGTWLQPLLEICQRAELPQFDELPPTPSRSESSRLTVEVTLRQYQMLRFAAARLNVSRSRLLYAWLRPHLAACNNAA